MKRILLYFAFLCFSFSSYAQYTAIPDSNFEAALAAYDDIANDGQVPTANIASLTTLDVSNSNIADLTGIEAFVALTQLDVNDNQLTSLDVSKNVALQTLNCHNNTAIEYLDLRNNTALTNLRCDNVGLRSLDFRNGNNTNVVSFQADNNNMRCIAIDDQFGAYTASWIKDGSTRYYRTVCEIYIPDDNFEQAFIDLRFDFGTPDNFVSVFPLDTLRKLNMSNRNINDLRGADYFASMEDFNISNNNITEFDFQYNTKLKKLDASSNVLTLININESPLLEELSINDNQLTSLDISNNVALLTINANNNDISSIDVSANTSLEILNLAQNELTNASDLILGTNTNFSELDVSDNHLEGLNLSGVSNINELVCGNNNVTDIDVNGFLLLEVLYAENNNLTTLDVSSNPVLGLLRVNNNDLSFLNIRNGNNVNFVEFNASNNPNLGCIQVDNAADAYAGGGNYAGWQIDGATSAYADQCFTFVPDDNFEQALIDAGYDTTGLDNFVPTANIASVVSFNAGTGGALYNKGITDLTGIEDFVSLTQLWSDGNPLTSIDLSKNTALNTMALIGTALTDLDLSGNTQLFFAVVRDNNQLTSINLSANTLLTNLTIGNNLLSAIDLSTNTALTKLNINNSSLSSIDLSANVRLDRIFIKDTPLSSLDLNTNTALANLELNATALTSIDLSTNTALSQLIVNNSSLTSLDLSANTVLDYLECTNNLLSNLDLSNNVLLEELYLSDNELTSIDLSTNTALNYLYCNDNSLTALDLSANPAMQELEVDNNQLTFLNVKNGSNLSTFSYISVQNNPNLSCIEVDDATAANAGTGNYSGWAKDALASYSEDCIAPVITLTGDNPQTIELGDGYTELGAMVDDGVTSLVIDITDFVDAVGGYTVTYNATDASGNVALEVTRTVNVVDTTAPIITLTGNNPQTIELGSGYTELGATTDDDVTNVIIDATAFVDAIGSYTIRYNATDASSNVALEVTRTVNVVDTTAPVITLTGDNPQTIELGAGYTELGATTDDGVTNVIIDATAFVDAIGSYTITYNATDASGNVATEVTRTVNVIDTTSPVITLRGDNPQAIELGAGYTELGATTNDGSNVVIDTSDFVDAIGSYTIRYNATDASGNTSVEVSRIVNVMTSCPIYDLPADNFTIQTFSETCVDKNNGIIIINAAETLNYIATVNNETLNFTSTLEVDNLSPGTYPVCIAIDGFTNCEQCFEVVIEAAESLTGKTELNTDSTTNTVKVEIDSGTAPYTVKINNEIVGEYNSNSFSVEVKNGDTIDVFSSLACEGKLSTKVNLFDETRIAPNPTRGNVIVSMPNMGSKTIVIDIYNSLGMQVSSGVYNIIDNKVTLVMDSLPQGIYFVQINEATPRAFKIVKQ